jgi:DNA repair protein RadA/Sms
MAKPAPAFGCRDCGDTFARWAGRCPSCGAMNSVTQLTAAESAAEAAQIQAEKTGKPGRANPRAPTVRAAPGAATALTVEDPAAPTGPPPPRISSGDSELDRVLGGGFAPGMVTVLGGEPGIGKSTLLAQVAGMVGAHTPALYVTAEEATAQVAARLDRLSSRGAKLRLAATNDASAIALEIAGGAWTLVVVDSIQLIALPGSDGEAGGVAQCKACAAAIVEAAKKSGTAVVIVGHVTKDGGLAGPRLLEHLVDTVLAFEGDRYADLRVLRAVKNRYGATSEIGLFRMGAAGLIGVPDAGAAFIADRDPGVTGSCVVPSLEGNRCLLVEVQALVNPTEMPQPTRRVAGLDPNRVHMVVAVLTRRLKFPLGTCDVFVNATGGARLTEPGADLAIALAIASAWKERPVPPDLVAVGEVGLGGELRPAPRYELRANEARRLGFQRLVGPGGGAGRGRLVTTRLADAVEAALGS